MWTLSNKPKTHKVTKALARQFMEMDPAPHDRPLSERRLLVYERLFSQGSFRPCTWATATCKETGTTYRVNGKHTSTILSMMEPLPEYYVTIEEYDCETLDDVARLYATFDSKMQSRTVGDINASFAATVPELREIAGRTINVSVSGLSLHFWGRKASASRQPAERAELILEHSDFIKWLDKLFTSNLTKQERRSCQHLIRMGVVAAMFGSWNKAKGPATEFWMAVRDETGREPTLPDRKLSRFLLSTTANRGIGIHRKKTASEHEFMIKCIHAWNAWRKGVPTSLRYDASKEAPAYV